MKKSGGRQSAESACYAASERYKKMNELEKIEKTKEAFVKAINESKLPPSTIHYMLMELDQMVINFMTGKERSADDHSNV